MKNPWHEACEQLHVKPNSSLEEIQRAFRGLAKKYHPDQNKGDPKAAEKFQAIHNAFEFLKNNFAAFQAELEKSSTSRQSKNPVKESINVDSLPIIFHNPIFPYSKKIHFQYSIGSYSIATLLLIFGAVWLVFAKGFQQNKTQAISPHAPPFSPAIDFHEPSVDQPSKEEKKETTMTQMKSTETAVKQMSQTRILASEEHGTKEVSPKTWKEAVAYFESNFIPELAPWSIYRPITSLDVREQMNTNSTNLFRLTSLFDQNPIITVTIIPKWTWLEEQFSEQSSPQEVSKNLTDKLLSEIAFDNPKPSDITINNGLAFKLKVNREKYLALFDYSFIYSIQLDAKVFTNTQIACQCHCKAVFPPKDPTSNEKSESTETTSESELGFSMSYDYTPDFPPAQACQKKAEAQCRRNYTREVPSTKAPGTTSASFELKCQ